MTFHLESGSHPNKQGNYTIFLSINHQGERKRIKTSIIPIKFWDTINKLSDYVQSLGVKDMDFRDITPAFISGFTAYLQTLTNRRNPDTTLSPNSIAKHLKILRAIQLSLCTT